NRLLTQVHQARVMAHVRMRQENAIEEIAVCDLRIALRQTGILFAQIRCCVDQVYLASIDDCERADEVMLSFADLLRAADLRDSTILRNAKYYDCNTIQRSLGCKQQETEECEDDSHSIIILSSPADLFLFRRMRLFHRNAMHIHHVSPEPA